MTKEELSRKIRTQIYDSVWIDEEEEVFMQKTEGIVEDRIDDYLRDLVNEGYIKWIKPRNESINNRTMAKVIGHKKNVKKCYKSTCKYCRAVIIFDEDEVREATQYNEYCFSYAACPECGKNVTFDKYKDRFKGAIETAKPKWISVKDRMPTEEGRYLCIVDDYDVHEVVDFINGYFNIDEPVEFWMPLPEPPKTKQL